MRFYSLKVRKKAALKINKNTPEMEWNGTGLDTEPEAEGDSVHHRINFLILLTEELHCGKRAAHHSLSLSDHGQDQEAAANPICTLVFFLFSFTLR